MNAMTPIPYKTRAQQRLEYLLSLTRPLDEVESDELYRALHADYMRKWRAHRIEHKMTETVTNALPDPHMKGRNLATLQKVLEESRG